MSVDDQKRAAGEAAADLVRDGMTLGLGTGSTADWFVRALAARGRRIKGVATSRATETLARSLGVALADLDEAGEIDLTVDGADEIDADLRLIKGAGGALLREKLVWLASRRCVVIADAGKRVKTLGKSPLPIEVVAFGHAATAARIAAVLREHGIESPPVLRTRDGAAFRTDSGNCIFDVACGTIGAPERLASALKAVTGVVDHGLFLGLADQALIGAADGVKILQTREA